MKSTFQGAYARFHRIKDEGVVAKSLEVCLLKWQFEKADFEASYLAIYNESKDVLLEEIAIPS